MLRHEEERIANLYCVMDMSRVAKSLVFRQRDKKAKHNVILEKKEENKRITSKNWDIIERK